MPGVYQRKGRDGKRSKTWTAWWVDEDGRKREAAAGRDKATAKRIAETNDARARLVQSGILSRADRSAQVAAARPLAEHVEDYRLALLAKRDKPRHAAHVAGALTRLFADASVVSVADLAVDRIQSALGRLRGRRSARTANHARGAVLAFVRWLEDTSRIKEVPRGLRKQLPVASEDADRRRRRRALTPAEVGKLLAAAAAGPDRYVYGPTKSKAHKIPVTGPARAMLYRLALGTGFRAEELRSLTPESFRLDADPPFVVIEGAYSKNKKTVEQQISPELARHVREWLAAGNPLPLVPDRAAAMLRADLEAAGVPYETPAGVADFHATRHSYITNLIASGASVKTAQELARHSSPTLTIGRYSHTSADEKRKALEGGE